MISPFNFARLPFIHFGAGKSKDLPGIAARYGRHVLLVTGAVSFDDSGRAGLLLEQFASLGVKTDRLAFRGEPSPGLVDAAAERYRGQEISAVVSIGGGSVIDAGKAISAMLMTEGSVEEYLEVVGTKEPPGAKVPFIALPTTSGTGSEATKNAVISRIGAGGFKRSLRHDNFVPDVAIVDPELTINCPGDITAAAGMDCFTQLAESYLSTKGNEMTDALALRGMEAISRSLVRSFTDGSDVEARSDMSFAALLSGICLANAGLGAVHGLAGTIGALFDIPHGVVCGTLMAKANELNVVSLRHERNGDAALGKYATLGRIFSETGGKSDSYYIDFFIDYLKAVTWRLGLPLLGNYGIDTADIPSIVSQSDVKNNPVRFTDDQMSELLTGRL
jgi:alcohol dehydrogenase class IV